MVFISIEQGNFKSGNQEQILEDKPEGLVD
jgi:hypothetical protein